MSGFVNDNAALNVFGETPAETSLHHCLNHWRRNLPTMNSMTECVAEYVPVQRSAGCTSIVEACLTANDWIISQVVVFVMTATMTYSLTAVPRLSQPSTLHATVKWVSALELSNNKRWRGLRAQVIWPGQRVGNECASLHSSNEPGQLSQWLWSW